MSLGDDQYSVYVQTAEGKMREGTKLQTKSGRTKVVRKREQSMNGAKEKGITVPCGKQSKNKRRSEDSLSAVAIGTTSKPSDK